MALDNPPFRSPAEIAVEFHTAVPDSLFRYQLGVVESVTNVTELIAMSTIDVNALGLVDVRGIEYATSLISLKLQNNEIETLDIVELTGLTYADVSGNDIAALDARTLVNMGTMFLGGNLLEDFDVSTLINLVRISINNNLIAQAEMEGIIDAFYANRVALGALSCVINLTSNPGSSLAAASKAAEITAIELEGSTVTI